MSQAELPSQKQVFDWMNSCIAQRMTKITKLEDLADGMAYLHVANSMIFKQLNDANAEVKPTSSNSKENFEILARILQRKGVPFTFKIQKLALPSLYEHFRLSLFLYELFKKPAQAELKLSQSTANLKILPPRNVKALLLEKGLNAHISLRDLQNLQSKRRLNEIKCSINQSLSPNIRLSDIEANIASIQTDMLKDCQNTANQKVIIHIATNLQRTFDRNYIDMLPKNAKQLQQTFRKTFKIPSHQKFYAFLRNLTINFLRNKAYFPLVDEDQESQQACIFKKFLKMPKNFQLFNFLFYGKGEDQKIKQNLRKYCGNYYRSIEFLQLIVGNCYQRMKAKLTVIAYLKKIQLLPLKRMTQQQFDEFPQQYIDIEIEVEKNWISQYNQQLKQRQCKRDNIQMMNEENIPVKMEIEHKIKCSNDDDSEQMDSNEESLDNFNNIIEPFNPYKEIHENQQEYWNIHRITLIAYELQYVKKKDPNYDPQDLTHKSITDHSKFVTGFMFTCLRGVKGDAVGAIVHSGKYRALSALFKGRTATDRRLAEFAAILLSLKHAAVLREFAAAYDAIVAAIDGVSFAEVKAEQSRFAAVEAITQTLTGIAADIDEALRRTLLLDEAEGDAITLLRATVYCFLAEKFAFHTNELWGIAFPQYHGPQCQPSKKEQKWEVKAQ